MKNINPVATNYLITNLEQRVLYTCPSDKAFAIVKPHITVLEQGSQDILFSLYIRETVEGLVTRNESYLTSIGFRNGVPYPEIHEFTIPNGSELVLRADRSNSILSVRTDGLEFMDDSIIKSAVGKNLSLPADKWVNVTGNVRTDRHESRVELAFTNNVDNYSDISLAIAPSDMEELDDRTIASLQIKKGEGILTENILISGKDSVFIKTDSNSVNVITNSLNTDIIGEVERIANRTYTIQDAEGRIAIETPDVGVSFTRMTLNPHVIRSADADASTEVSIYIVPNGGASTTVGEDCLWNNYLINSTYVAPEVASIIVPKGYSVVVVKGYGSPINIGVCMEYFFEGSDVEVPVTRGSAITTMTEAYKHVSGSSSFATGSLSVNNNESTEAVVALYIETNNSGDVKSLKMMEFAIEQDSSILISNIRIGRDSRIILDTKAKGITAQYNGIEHFSN